MAKQNIKIDLERKVYSTTFDYPIQTIVDMYKKKEVIIPDFQRDYVWNSKDEEKPSRLIESLLLNMPIPNFYFAEDETLKYSVIDGQQRIKTVYRFFEDEFKLTGLDFKKELEGKKYSELDEIDRDKIRKRGIRVIVIGNESNSEVRFDIFERLNSGSMSLSSQDIRHAIYNGSLNQLLIELSPFVNKNMVFSKAIDKATKSAEEMILRFFAFYDQGENDFGTVDNYIKLFLNDFMKNNKDMSKERIDKFKLIFQNSLAKILEYCGEKPFQRITKKNYKEGKGNRSIFDFLMLAFAFEKNIKIPKERFLEVYKKTFENDDQMKKNLGYTNKKNLGYNVDIVRKILRGETEMK